MAQARQPNVLCVDDTPANLLAYEALLANLGANLVLARSGKEALEKIMENEFAVILLDVMMPGMDGFEVAKIIRQTGKSRETPIIFISAYVSDEMRTVQGYQLGAVDFIHKPVSPDILRFKVNVFVELYRQAQIIKEQAIAETNAKWEAERLKKELEQEEVFRLFVDNVKDYGIFMMDILGRVTSWNPTAANLFGFEAEEVVGRHFSLIFTAEDLKNGVPESELRIAEKKGRAEDTRWHIRKKGDQFWAEGVVTPLTRESGRSRGFCKIVKDQTSQKVAHEELDKALKRTRTVLESIAEAYIMLDSEFRFLDLNSKAQEYLKKSKEELLGRVFWEVFPQGKYSEFFTHYTRVLNENIPAHFEAKSRISHQWFEVHAYPCDEGISIYYRDVTSRRLAQSESAEKARLLDLTSDAIFVRDKDDKISYWNRGAELLYGWTAEEALSRTPHELLKTVFPNSLGDTRAKIIHAGFWQGELIHTKKSGEKIVVFSRWAVEREPNGEVRRILESNTDITERKSQHQKLEQLAAELSRSNRDLEHFAYVASHDLREPLRTIAAFLELLSKRYQGKFDEQADEYIRFAVDGARRMNALIEGLLEYARVEAQKPRLEPVDLDEVAKEALKNLKIAIEESKAEISIQSLPVVNGNRAQLTQLFQNLIGNAIKYRKGEPPKVRVASDRRGNEWVICVSDNGIGFEMEHADRVFRLFERLHARHEYSGTGIGLAVCKKIIELHGGNIWAKSSPGEGSTFYFSVPADKASRENAA